MQLPKQLGLDGIETRVRAALENDRIALHEDSEIQIPHLHINPKMRKSIFQAKASGAMVIGYDDIEKWLANELRGLTNVDNKSERISRLLIVTNDGSPRFYRELTYLRNTQGKRVLICRIDIDSERMAHILGMMGSKVKSLLINRKKSVVALLASLV